MRVALFLFFLIKKLFFFFFSFFFYISLSSSVDDESHFSKFRELFDVEKKRNLETWLGKDIFIFIVFKESIGKWNGHVEIRCLSGLFLHYIPVCVVVVVETQREHKKKEHH